MATPRSPPTFCRLEGRLPGLRGPRNRPCGGAPQSIAPFTLTVEQRITSLKASLKITAGQENGWNAVATTMRDNAAAMDKLVKTKRAIAPESMTAVDDLNTFQDFTQVFMTYGNKS